VNKFNNIFGQILQIFSPKDPAERTEFYKAVIETRAERGAKGFTCWQQFVAMLFCQIGQAHSLREITGGLASCLGKLKHLGVDSDPNRSTLSYANEHRPWWWLSEDILRTVIQMQGIVLWQKEVQI
jgi:hypothetical protein